MEMQTQVVRDRSWPLAEIAAAVLLVAALLFGGGSRGVGDLVVHLAAIPAALMGIMRWRHAGATRMQRGLLYLMLAALAVPVLQLVPLPASVFETLPGRSAVVADLRLAGVEPAWLPMTLDRWGTVRGALALATTLAMWLLCSTLAPASLERLLRLAVVVAVPLVLLGFAQAGAGQDANLYAYEFQNRGVVAGLFANRNHMAALLAMLAPVAMVCGYRAQQARQPGGMFGWYGALVLLLLGAAMTFSRTGALLATVAAVGMALVLFTGAPARNTGLRRHAGWVAALLVTGAAIGNYAWGRLIDRFAKDPLGDRRWDYIEHGLAAIKAWWPWGSGVGSFREAYAPYEPVQAMESTHALHAHNELVEVGVEAGLPGLLLALLLAGFCAVLLVRALQNHGTRNTAFVKACAIAAVIPLGHGLVDYPLRTLTVATVFALVLAQCASSAGVMGMKKKDT